jgi:hypothetical protein
LRILLVIAFRPNRPVAPRFFRMQLSVVVLQLPFS